MYAARAELQPSSSGRQARAFVRFARARAAARGGIL
eukprot:SAG31_NODE_34555_length_331_cov_2.681034_1_plen_35_part_10